MLHMEANSNMEDFSSLAARIAVGVGGLRGCLILSRDGLELGSYPAGEEGLIKPAWLRFAALGDPEKGFVEFGDELWVYVRRGPYAVFAVGAATVRPGVIMDGLEQLLLAAEEARAKRDALKVPEVPDAPKGKPRTSLHKEPKHASPAHSAPVGTEALSTQAARSPAATPERSDALTPDRAPDDGDEEVDRVLLAQEFSRLLQGRRTGDEGKGKSDEKEVGMKRDKADP